MRLLSVCSPRGHSLKKKKKNLELESFFFFFFFFLQIIFFFGIVLSARQLLAWVIGAIGSARPSQGRGTGIETQMIQYFFFFFNLPSQIIPME